MSNLTGKILNKQYILQKVIGSGGMSTVYKAWDKARLSSVAVKALRSDLVTKQQTLRMFEQEAEFLKKMPHPNITPIYEFNVYNNIHYLVMEWINGNSLDVLIKKQGKPFTVNHALSILSPIVSALHYLHFNKILHCDIKPANIMVANNNEVYLTDFGVARFMKDGNSGGTPPYMAPEQFTGRPISERTDIYSLGVTVFEMLSGGVLPFRGTTPESRGSTSKERIEWEHKHLPIPGIREFNGSITGAVEKVLLRALSKVPEKRYPSVQKFYDAFDVAKVSHGNGRKTILTGPDGLSPSESLGRKTGELQVSLSYPIISVDFDRKYKGQLRLVGLQGEWKGRLILLTHNQITFGRSAHNQVKFEEISVSRWHATIFKTQHGVFIEDDGSSLGTFVNKRRITKQYRLRHGDVIQIGYGQFLEFRDK